MAKSATEIEESIRQALFPAAGDIPDQTAEMIVKSFMWLSASTRALAIQRSGRYISFLTRAAESSDAEVRRSALEILERTGGTRVLRGLAAFLKDRSPELRNRAAEAMIREIDEHVRATEAIEAGGGALSTNEVSTKRKAHLEAIYIALSSYPIHKNADLIEALLRLDGGAHGLPIELLRRAKDPRQQFILEVLQTRCSDTVISFLCKMLGDPSQRVRNRVHDVITRRDDGNFVRAFLQAALSEDWPQLSWALPELSRLVWLESGHPLLKSQPRPIQLRAIAFMMATGMTWAAKMSKLEEIAGTARTQPAPRKRTKRAGVPHPELLSPLARAPKEMPGAPSPLELHLDAPDQETQLKATETLAALNVPQKHALLVKQLSSPFKSVRRLAMHELAQGSFRRYLEMFERMDEDTRIMVGRTVAKIDDLMLDQLESELFALDPTRRLRALKVIETIRLEREVEKFLIELAADPNVKVRATVVKLLGLVDSGTSLKAMINCLSDDDTRVQANTVEAFERINDPRFVDLLRPFVRHPDNRVRANAAKALWRLGDRDKPFAALGDMLTTGTLDMRLSAAWTLRNMGVAKARDLLERAAFRDPSMRVRTMAQESLESLEKQPA